MSGIKIIILGLVIAILSAGITVIVMGNFLGCSGQPEVRGLTKMSITPDFQIALDKALIELIELAPNNEMKPCPGFIAGNFPGKKLDFEGRRKYFSEKGWQEYNSFADGIKSILKRREMNVSLSAIEEQQLHWRQADREKILHLKVLTNYSNCGNSGHGALDLTIGFSNGPKGAEPGFVIDEWKVEKFPVEIGFTGSY